MRTGRVCPVCGAVALVGHGLRRRSVHLERAGPGQSCSVEWILVQRVRCKACGRTHTLLPAFLAPYRAASNRCVPAGGGPAAQNYPFTRVANRTPGLGDHPGESSEGKVSAARKGGTHQGGERVTGSQHEANAAAS